MYVKNWSEVLGRSGPFIPAHKLAKKYIKEGKPITATEVNNILEFSNINITQEMLDKILSKPRLHFYNLDSNTIKSDKFINNIGTLNGKIKVPGVYIWIHLSTGRKYVGSSSGLARRLIGYFNGTHKSTGNLIPLIKDEGVSSFKLEVIPLKDSYTINQELSLEQYFLLHSEYNLNVLRVVNDFSGARAKPLYMYTKDLSQLIYSSDVKEDFIFKLGIHHSIISKSLNKGEYYLNKYIFMDKPILNAEDKNLSLEDINNILDQDRIDVQKTKSRKVLIKSVNNENDTREFNSVSECVRYLNTIASSSRSSLIRHIASVKPYQGYICKYSSEGIENRFKSVPVSITHLPTGDVKIYSSYREAALSFAPKYKTVGQTIREYATTGNVFKDEYIISVL
jgi:hypothetical protein